MRLVHVMLSIPLCLASLSALIILLAAIRIKEGHITMYPEHMYGLDMPALCLLFVAAFAATFFYKGTPQRIKDIVSTFKSPQSTMSVQSPIMSLLDVPDLVGNVFERLDPASRRAFFQAHPDVAQNGHVLAHAKLRIELTPHSLEDQWLRVLRLSRSQPLRCLVITASTKKRLRGFLYCVPKGKHKEKHRLLQGTELQLQVLIKLETGDLPCLQKLLRSWRSQSRVGNTRVQLVLDLCGRELSTTTVVDLEPSNCTLMNGTLQLPDDSWVWVDSGDRAKLSRVAIVGKGSHEAIVDVRMEGVLEMEDCCVEGIGREVDGAVILAEPGASLHARRCSIQSNQGGGLVVCGGGCAALEHVSASSCGMSGVRVEGDGSKVSATHCRMDGNSRSNLCVQGGAHACVRHVSSNGSREGDGWYVQGSLVASGSSASGNKRCGIWCGEGQASLSRITTSENGLQGFIASGQGSRLEVCDSQASSNKWSGVECVGGSFTSLSRMTARENGLQGFEVSGQGSRLEVCDSQASSNKWSGVECVEGSFTSLSHITASENGLQGFVVSGQGRLEMSDSVASSNKEGGAWCDAGASASLSRITTSENGLQGFVVSGQGSCLEVSASQASSNKWSGVECAEGGFASLCRVTASGNGTHGLYVSGQASSEVSDSSASSNKWSGVECVEGSLATLCQVTASGNGLQGCAVLGQGHVEVCDSVASSNKQCGVFCTHGGSARLSRVTSSWNGSGAWGVHNQGSSLLASDSCASGNQQYGAWCDEGGIASLSHITASDNVFGGVLVSGQGSRLEVSRSSASKNGYQGLLASDQGSRLEVSDSQASSNKWSGVECFEGGSASLCRVTASGNGLHGLDVFGQASDLWASDCSTISNKKCGIFCEGGSARLSCVTSSWNGSDAWCARKRGSVVASGSSASNNNRRCRVAAFKDAIASLFMI